MPVNALFEPDWMRTFFLSHNNNTMKKVLLFLSALALWSCNSSKTPDIEKIDFSEEQVAEYWQTGKTLPAGVAIQYQPELINMPQDKGYNVLIDVSHQCSFASLWGLGGRLHELGYRSITNQASVNTVLDPEGFCRIRIPYDTENKIYPFAWYPNFNYNVIITEQTDLNAQHYTDKEIKAMVDFVKDGGALVIGAVPVGEQEKLDAWALNQLVGEFGAKLTTESDKYRGMDYAVLNVNDDWTVVAKGENGKCVIAQREFEGGKVTVLGHVDAIRTKGDDEAYNQESKQLLDTLLAWSCEGQDKQEGEPRLPQPMGGGGAIYPELEFVSGDIVVYYTENQKQELIDVVKNEYPRITELVQSWIPSKPTKEPMYLILSAGDGGGWAVNAFKPKENGIISLSAKGLISIYAHELAHTMGGPRNVNDEIAGRSPLHEQGEAHAGWFQGKIDAVYDSTLIPLGVKNSLAFYNSPRFGKVDLVKYNADPEYQEKVGKGADWALTWYIWQMMDETYGNTWYPRWRWIQYNRWKDEPQKQLTFEETFEDMSIAVGEDLFPFINSLGVSLSRKNMGTVEYNGEKITLKPARVKAKAPSRIVLDPIGDYKQELK